MSGRLPRYFLLSFLSFCFFTVIFQTMADAQETTTQLQSPLPTQSVHFIPTPTIYTQPSLAPLKTVSKPISFPSPTPTIYIAQPQPINTPAPIQQTPQPTKLPTISPTDTPVPTTIPTSDSITQGPTDIETLFSKYSGMYSVSEDELKKIAQCESGFNTASDTGTYAGMFQFSASTWSSVRTRMGLDQNPDLRKNAEEAIHTTAFMLSQGEENAWPNCH